MSQKPPLHPAGKLFAVVAIVEAITWAGLLLGMYLKYGPQGITTVSWWFGRLHGVAFLAYVAAAIYAAWRLRWPASYALLAILAAIPPLVTLPLEIWYRRKGLLSVQDGQAARGGAGNL